MRISGGNMTLDFLMKLLSSIGTTFSSSLVKTVLEDSAVTINQDADKRAQVLSMSVMFTSIESGPQILTEVC